VRLHGAAFAAAAQALREVEEQAKTLATRAQAAQLDDHPEGALRSFLQLHELVVPVADRWVATQLPADTASSLSSAAGLLELWRELPDLDCERHVVTEALLWHAAQAGQGSASESESEDEGPLSLVLSAEALAGQAAWLGEQLRALPVPRSRYFRRLVRSARGGLGDRARVQVQRGALTVLERLPDSGPPGSVDGHTCTTALGRFAHGDRMTLQWQNPLPGQVAILHAAGDEHDAELTVLVPELDSEAAPRRYHEVIEVVGELSHVPGSGHALIILWVPELVPPRWVLDVLARRGLPPEARLWRYTYDVEAPAAS
jgi:hypothetical protein